MSLITLSQGNVEVDIRETDGYMNATKLCQSAGKLWGTYYQNKTTQDFLAAAGRSIGIPIHPLINSITTGPNSQRGTWVHPQVAIHLAQWLSPDFAVAVTSLVLRYSKGEVTTEESQALAADIAAAKRPSSSSTSTEVSNEGWVPSVEEKQEHCLLMKQHGHLAGMYLARIGLNLVKFGMTARSFKERFAEHVRDFPQIQFFGLRPTTEPLALEQKFKSHEMISQNLTTYTSPNDKTHTEVIALAYPEITKTYLRSVMEDQHMLMMAKQPETINAFSVEIEKERTKRVQIEQDAAIKRAMEEETTKRATEQEATRRVLEEETTKREQETTKRMQIELEMLRLRTTTQHSKSSSLSASVTPLTAEPFEIFVKEKREQNDYPDYFRGTQDEMRETTNPLFRFLRDANRVVYDETANTTIEAIRRAFSAYIRKPVSKRLDHATFAQVNHNWLVKQRKVCDACRSPAQRSPTGGRVKCCEWYDANKRHSEYYIEGLRLLV